MVSVGTVLAELLFPMEIEGSFRTDREHFGLGTPHILARMFGCVVGRGHHLRDEM